jgi:hypothetical protein
MARTASQHLDLGPQYRGNDRHRHIIDRAHLVTAQPIDVVDLDGGDENDCRPLKPRMIANHRRELKTVQLRHANIDQDDGGLVLEQKFQRLARRRCLDEVFPELAKNLFVGQQLRRLIVHQEDVDFIVHGPKFLHGQS